ncbi:MULTISPECIES: translation initiation factor IF-3 [Salinicola]|uniref:translation initiation factor IF-3 n=1 Tax=Salinicola TaxID=404432 RepID=UPI00094E4CA9|nr:MULTISPECIES: translation initiation factor IF-3 [Salinicola]OLO06397.1 translation initiation factor IF-3 [Salinicola sp. MH3R3-1]
MKRNNQRGRPQEKRAPINDRIHADEVRLIDAEGEQLGVVPMQEALQRAEEAGMDLVQISNADPIVCKIMDYGKFLFEQKKQKSAQKKKTKQIQVKEVKFRPGTDEGDYQVKLKNLIRFLEGGDKGKVTLRFRGREMAHQDIGRRLMERIAADLEELAAVESFPKMEGRQMIMILAPKKK